MKKDEGAGGHVCPWWMGYLLLIPIRRFPHNPQKILGPYIQEGMTVLDIGPGMGFFSLPLARMVGQNGKVICIDLQERMIETLNKRARKAGLSDIIRTRLCSNESLHIDDLAGTVDFALAFAIIHEVSDKARLLHEIFYSLKREGRILLAEPVLHVKKDSFNESLSIARSVGFEIIAHPKIKRTHAVLLRKP